MASALDFRLQPLDTKAASGFPEAAFALCVSCFLVDVQWGSSWEGDGGGLVEGAEGDFAAADAECDGNDGSQEFAMLAGEEPGRRQFIVAVDGHILDGCFVTDFPDEVVGSSETEPRFQDVTDAISLALPFQKPSRVLQPKPEPHETFLGVFDFHFD